MTGDYLITLDEDLKKDLADIIGKVKDFNKEKNSIVVSLMRQRRLPELYEFSNN